MFASLDFICDYCDRAFTRKYNLQTHIENCHMTTDCLCRICGQSFGSPAGMQQHYIRGHNRHNQPFPECDICGRIFTRKQNILLHMTSVHLHAVLPEIRCKHCYRTFATERNLKRHLNQQHNPDVEYPICNECHKIYKTKTALLNHISRDHEAEDSIEVDDIRCKLCGKTYINKRNLKRHIEQSHGEREKEEIRCDICTKTYSTNHSLKRHVRTCHATNDPDTYQCEICYKMITGKENIDVHIQNYHQPKDEDEDCNDENDSQKNLYFCEECNNSFVEEPLLRQHVKSEHSFDSFYNYCKKSLIIKCGLSEMPVLIKTETSCIYNCEYCTNNFTSVYELKDHMKVSHDKEYSLCVCNVCFGKFYCKETIFEHKKICIPPPNVNACMHCDKLFTDISSLEFHTRIFHPQAQIADSKISSTFTEDLCDTLNYKCSHCDRVYYSERSLKHHIKLKHTTDEAVECEICGKQCNNKYYLASHIKIVHNNDSWAKCDYCNKEFKSKRNIRRHIECTHLGMQRYKCIECETLFKEKRSLRKHVRTKHPNSAIFPQCHVCYKRFESAKSCKIHLKLLHSFNMNTYPCDLCSVSFSSNEALLIHLRTKHLAEDEIYKCEECNLVFKGHEKFDQHNELNHVNLVPNVKQKLLPQCVICMKDFSTRKTLKRHIKKFHHGFDVDELANFGTRKRNFKVDCEDCLKNFNDDLYLHVYQKQKHVRDSIIFKCDSCNTAFNTLEYSVQRYKMANLDLYKSKMILSELCTTEMSIDGEGDDENDENSFSGFGSLHEMMEPESTTIDIQIKLEPEDPDYDIN